MYGLVLEGGGAKGSYQIGACKALQELGIEIGAVAGTSIGALNGALIVQGELEKAYDLWYDITPSQVFDIEEVRLEELKKLNISHDGLLYFMKKAKEIAASKGLDITFAKELLYRIINEKKLRNSKMNFGFVTISLSDMKPLELFMEDVPEGKVVEYLLASANLPAFKQDKIDGKHYLDGGFYDNLPLNMLARKGYKEIIAVRTKALGRTRKITDKSVKVRTVEPDENIGRILDFNTTQARHNLKLGYYDALKQFQGLKGRKYYLSPTGDEDLFLNFLLSPGEETIIRLGETFGIKGIPFRRLLLEHIIPKLAFLLDLKKESSYEELVIAILEIIAVGHNMDRFRIYSWDDFLGEIRKGFNNKPKTEEIFHLPLFLRQNAVLSSAAKDRIVREIIHELFEEYLNPKDIAQ